MRLIDADKIIYSWQIDPDGQEHDGITLQSIITKMPTIKERKTGRWIPHNENVNDEFTGKESYKGGVMCSECGFKTHNKIHLLFECPYNFCPHCGSLMEAKHE